MRLREAPGRDRAAPDPGLALLEGGDQLAEAHGIKT